MRILYLAHRTPYPADKGDKIRSFHEVHGLAARGHDVHLLAFADNPLDLGHEAALLRACASVRLIPLHRTSARASALARLSGSQPFSVGYFGSRRMRRAVQESIERVDPEAVVVYSSPMAQYVPSGLAARTVVDLVDVDSEKWSDYARMMGPPRSWLYRSEAIRLRRYEQWIAGTFAHAVVATPRELGILRSGGGGQPSGRMHAITNGVEVPPTTARSREEIRDGLPAAERTFLAGPSIPRLVFTGMMDYHPNADGVCYFVREILPLVQAVEPRVQFLIAGRNPTAVVRRLSHIRGVIVTGAVDDVRPYLAASAAAVVPLRIARGIQNKVLEAMAAGCPVVTTSEVAASLTARPGTDFLVGASPRAFADSILSILRDQQLRLRLQRAGRAFVLQHHQWAPALRQFTGLVEQVGLERVPA